MARGAWRARVHGITKNQTPQWPFKGCWEPWGILRKLAGTRFRREAERGTMGWILGFSIFTCWNLIPRVMAFCGGPLERWLAHESRVLMNGISPLFKKVHREFPSLRHGKETVIQEPRLNDSLTWALTRHRSCQLCGLGLPSLLNCEKQTCVVEATLAIIFCYGAQAQTKWERQKWEPKQSHATQPVSPGTRNDKGGNAPLWHKDFFELKDTLNTQQAQEGCSFPHPSWEQETKLTYGRCPPAPGGKWHLITRGREWSPGRENPAQTDLGKLTLVFLVTFPPLAALAQALWSYSPYCNTLSVQFCMWVFNANWSLVSPFP